MIYQTRSYRRNKLRLWVALASIGLAMSACDRAPPSPTYFPLNDGLRWQYRLTTSNGLGQSETEIGFRAQSVTSESGPGVAARLSSLGTRYFFDVTEAGIFRVAKQTAADATPVHDPVARAVLKLPVRVGTNWTSTTHPYVLARLLPMGVDIRHSVTLSMNYTIAAIDTSVTVPAGTYSNCVKVIGRATYGLYGDGRSGFISIPVTTEEWYAPDVGLVKLVRTEEVETDIFTGGTATLELIDFRD